MAEAIITPAEIRAAVPQFSVNVDQTKLTDQMIIDAQRHDVRPFLGDAFYYEQYNAYLNSSPIPQATTDLIEGKVYTEESSGQSVQFYGLKQVIIYYTWARVLQNINLFFTRSGAKTKNFEQSTLVPNSELSSWVNAATSKAISYQNDTLKFLAENDDDYPTWVNDCQEVRKQSVKMFSSHPNRTNYNINRYYRGAKDKSYWS